MNSLINFLYSTSKVAIITHQNADPDAISSAIGIEYIIHKINPKIDTILIVDSMSKVSIEILNKFYPEKRFKSEVPKDVERYIITDTNNKMQLGNIDIDLSKPIFIIDHHAERIDKITDTYIIKTDYTSAAEIVTEIFQELKIIPSPEVANLLLTGILFDTRRFMYTGNATLKNVVWLIEHGAIYHECLKSLQIEIDYSERVARVKAALRAELIKIKKWIILISNVSSFEASACRALIELGADVAIVISEKENKIRVSSRSTEEFYNSTNFHLGTDLMEPLGKKIQGSGGGHASAAGANGFGTTEEVKSIIIELISKIK